MRFAKHIHVLYLLSQIPVREKEYHPRAGCKYVDAERMGPYVTGSWKVVMTSKQAVDSFDHLFHYIHTNFREPATAIPEVGPGPHVLKTVADRHEYIDCRELLVMERDEFAAKLESLPPYFLEHTFPVAVARYMLRELAMPIDHRISTQFPEFYRRYGNMILDC